MAQLTRNRDIFYLACRAAMLREAADAFPPGNDRELLLIQLRVLEERFRAQSIRQASSPAKVYAEAAE